MKKDLLKESYTRNASSPIFFEGVRIRFAMADGTERFYSIDRNVTGSGSHSIEVQVWTAQGVQYGCSPRTKRYFTYANDAKFAEAIKRVQAVYNTAS